MARVLIDLTETELEAATSWSRLQYAFDRQQHWRDQPLVQQPHLFHVHDLGQQGKDAFALAYGLPLCRALDRVPQIRGNFLVPGLGWIQVRTRSDPKYEYGIESLNPHEFYSAIGVLVNPPTNGEGWQIVGWTFKEKFLAKRRARFHLPKPTLVMALSDMEPMETFPLGLVRGRLG